MEAVFVMCGKWLNLLLLGDSNKVKTLMEQQGIIGCVLSQSSSKSKEQNTVFGIYGLQSLCWQLV